MTANSFPGGRSVRNSPDDQGCRLRVSRAAAVIAVRRGGTPMDWRRLTVEYSAAAAKIRGVFAHLPRFC